MSEARNWNFRSGEPRLTITSTSTDGMQDNFICLEANC